MKESGNLVAELVEPFLPSNARLARPDFSLPCVDPLFRNADGIQSGRCHITKSACFSNTS